MAADRRAITSRPAIYFVAIVVSMGLGGVIAQSMQSWWFLAIDIPLGLGMGIGAAFLADRIEVNSDR